MINLVIALDCEARPIIEHYKLKRDQEHVFPVYRSENMQLIVSGVGKLNAATATAYLAGMTPESTSWLNIGIAGHKEHAIGNIYAAHKITDHVTQQNWYPAFCFKPGVTTESACTFETPINDYHDDLLHDMEAAGFYQTANRFDSVEFVHCLKVISDNKDNTTHKINKHMVTELISGQLDAIDIFIEKLSIELHNWNEITATPSVYEAALKQWHFSTYQQHQLRQLVKRWSTLHTDNPNSLIEELSKFKNSRDVLHHLQRVLDIH